MIARKKALVVPITVLALWMLPGADPGVVVAGTVEVPVQSSVQAEPELPESTAIESLADASPTTAVPVPTTVAVAPTTRPSEPPPVTSMPDAVGESVPAASATTAQVSEQTSSTVPLGERALELVAFDWQAQFPNWQVEFRGARDGIRALTFPAERRIEIFVRSSDTTATLHRVFAHELGHVIDVELNSDEDRERWLETRGIARDAPWWPSATSPDFHTGAGDFAEAFAVWETGVSSRSTIAGQPDAGDLELLRELAAG